MASLTNRFKYDVFLSFKAEEDTASDFAGNLYKALNDKGICTFMDQDHDKKLQKGEKLFKTIEESKTAIIVLSKNYASSLFCLEQLARILDCMKAKRRLVWPVFYNMDPSNLQRKTRSGKLMGIHKVWSNHYKNRLKKTKKALHQVANLSGFHLNNGDASGELELVERIVKEVSTELKLTSYTVEMKSQLKEVSSLLELGSDEVIMAGIHGVNKSKTTLARAVYKLIADQFEGSCFLDGVSENSNKHGLVYLQNMLLSEIGEEDIWFGNAYKGVSIIKHRLHKKKVLLVLDNVDTLEQLEFLVGGIDWFGSGSRVIITTRDKHLLAFHGIARRYEVQDFKSETFYAMFYYPRWPAVRSSLFGERVGEGRYALDDNGIQMILKSKFDALEKDTQSIFLDIVCCFNGYELTEVQNILCAHHGYNVKDQTEVLIYESMISIGDGKVIIHDLIEKMAKELVRQESRTEPGKRSRLWLPEDIIHVLKENTGSSKIEIIHLDIPSTEDERVIECDEEVFKNMTNLKILIIRRCHFSKALKHLPNSLRVLEWKTYPSQELPSNFDTKQLHICKLLNMDFISTELDELLKESTSQSVVEVSQTSNWVLRTLLTSKRVFNVNTMWRLVGTVSSVIGLLCYALSPSFNRLIGRWNILKLFLYGMFSLAIIITILFTKQFSVSPSTQYAQLKTYIGFAILMIISVYSIYYDKAVNGKPGILSLVSNAAFALMSLSLSKLMKFGFEMGIFAYFLGCFVIQLWTINRMLIFVAIIFGCPLFVMHSSSDSRQEVHRAQSIHVPSGSDPEVGNAGQRDVGNGSQVIIESDPDSQQEVSSEGQVTHRSSDSITEVASSGSGEHVDNIHEENSRSVVAL
nr:nodulation protein [Melilotus officinalis]